MTKLTFNVILKEDNSSRLYPSKLKVYKNKTLISLANDFQDTKWRSSVFHKFLWNNVAATALSAQRRAALRGKSEAELIEAAKNLRLVETDEVGRGSEIAEIFLYGLMTELFGALPIVPKIFYKQNVNDNAKGADAVHVVITEDGEYSLWFGEAKFYNSTTNGRLDSILKSVLESLSTEKIKKENTIIVGLRELEEFGAPKVVVEKIRAELDQSNSVDKLRSKINIPILLMHECNVTASATEWSESYVKTVLDSHVDIAERYFAKQLAGGAKVHKYDVINFFFILFPVPSKKVIVDRFFAVATAKRLEDEDR